MTSTMARITFFSCLLLLFIPHLTSAETKTFIKEYTYQASEIDSKVSCRVISLELVKRLLLEELGVYLESQTEVKNFQLTKDQITVLTAGIVRAEILDESWDGNTLKYFLRVKMVVDSESIIKSIDRFKTDTIKTKELADTRKMADQAIEEIERLKKDLSSTRADMDKMKQYNNAVNKLSAIDWFNMAEEEWRKCTSNRELIISYFEKAISLNQEYAEAYYRLGIEYMDKSDDTDGQAKQMYLDKSIVAYEKAIEHNKDKQQEKSYYSLLAHAYSYRGYVDKAIAARQKVIKILLEAREVIVPPTVAGHDVLEPGYVLEPIVTVKDDAELSSEYRMLGYAYEKKGDYRQAISAFNKAVQLSPDERNYSSLAFAYKSSGNFVEAINAFKKVVELSPKSWNYRSLGIAYKLKRDYDQAIKELTNALKVDPDDYQSYSELGSCYELKGNKKQAKAAYQKANELKVASKNKEEDFYKLSVDDLCNTAIREFGKEKESMLIWRYLHRAIELRPEYSLPHFWMGLHYLDEDQRGIRAISEFKRAIELGLNNTDVYYWLGEAYYLELMEAAITSRSKEVAAKEKDIPLKIYDATFKEAINVLNQAIKLNPDYENNYLVLGDIYRINRQFDIAQDNYKRASSIRKSTSLESEKYMTRYYLYKKNLKANLRRGCDEIISRFQAAGLSDDKIKESIAGGEFFPCSWLSVTRE